MKTPPVPTRPPTVLSVEQFDALYRAVDDPTMRLMLETAIESGCAGANSPNYVSATSTPTPGS